MKFNWKYPVIFVTLYLISRQLLNKLDNKRKMIFDAILKKYGQDKANKMNAVYDALTKAGMPGSAVKLAISQVMAETGVFSGKQRASTFNNFTGITWSGSKEQVATGAQKSPVALPNAEQPKDKATGKPIVKYFYAKYPNPLNWAKDYIRILSRGAMPINAQSPADFAYKLKLNKYYTADLGQYTKLLTFFHNFLTKSGV